LSKKREKKESVKGLKVPIPKRKWELGGTFGGSVFVIRHF